MRKLKKDIWEETPFKFGVYKHRKNGREAMARPAQNPKYDWEIDKGKVVPHPLFRVMMGVVEEGTGNFFFNKSLKDYDWVGDISRIKKMWRKNHDRHLQIRGA